MPDDNPIAVPRPHRRHKGRLTVRIGRRSSLRLDVAIDSTGLLAIGGLVSSILLSTAVIVGVVLLAAAAVAAVVGKREVGRAGPPVPQEAVRGLKQDVQTLKPGSPA